MERTGAAVPSPAETFEFDTLEALDALMSPFRLRLLACFRAPATVKQAADRLGVGVTRLYRHIHGLVGHGFLVVVEERRKGKTVEKVYSVSARNVRPSATFLQRYGAQGNAELFRLGFRTVEAEVVAAAEANPSLAPVGEHTTFSFTRLQLTESDLKELAASVESIVEEFRGRSGPIEVSVLGSVIPLNRVTAAL